MKLRPPLHFQQLLFIFLALAWCAGAETASAQRDAIVIYRANPNVQVPQKVVGVVGTSMMVQEQFGNKGVPLAEILEVRMARPPEVEVALQAFQAKDYPKALNAAKTVVDKYRGLPSEWAVSMSSLVGDIALAQADVNGASAAYDAFAKAYPANRGADLGKARIAVAKKDFESAKKTALPLKEKALGDKNVTPAESQVYGQAFLILGQIEEAQGDYQHALEDYLRTVTLFYYDPSATSLAQERADALRKSHQAFVP